MVLMLLHLVIYMKNDGISYMNTKKEAMPISHLSNAGKWRHEKGVCLLFKPEAGRFTGWRLGVKVGSLAEAKMICINTSH